MPHVDWLTCFLEFRDEEGDNATLHLLTFHMHVHKMKIWFLEDFLMKMFMASLEGKSRKWYEDLRPRILSCLKDFHIAFY